MESAYASTFLTTLEPIPAANLLRERVLANKAVLDDLAEWFRELQTIEQTYCRSLGKLASRLPTTDVANMGVMEKPWRRTIDNVNALATNHSKFATRLSEELINPLAQYDRSTESGNMNMLERNMTQISKDLEAAESKSSKAEQSKSKNKSSKQTDAQDDLRKARSRWDSESPNTFERLQAVDEARITFLKDALVKFETSAIDLHAAQIKMSEAAIAHLLEVNPTDEPMDFVGKRLSGNPTATTGAPRPTVPSLTRTTSHGDAGSVRSSGGAASSLKSKFGTLLKGRRSGSPNKRQSMFGSLGGSSGSSANRQTLPEMREEPEVTRETTRPNTATASSIAPPRTTESQSTAPISVATTRDESSLFQVQPPSNERSNPFVRDIAATSNAPMDTGISQIQSSEPTSGLQSSLRNVNIRSDSYNATNTHEDEAAMDKVSNTLRAQPTVSRRNRGRRSVLQEGSADTVAHDILGSPLPQAAEPIYPVAAGSTPTTIPTNGTLPDRAAFADRRNTASFMSYDGTESIRSTRSNSSAGPSSRHVEPTTDGLHLSVIETVSVTVGTEGTVANLNVVGEAAVALRIPTDQIPVQLKIQSSDAISRIVANNHVLTSVDSNTYQLPAEAAPSLVTLFKYQVEPESSRHARFMPILLTQKWSTEANQTSVKISYRLNPLFGAGSLNLQDVEVAVSVNGQAQSCVAKPAGTFVKRSSRLVWRLNELTLESGQEGSLLARFKTLSPSPPTDSVDIKFRTTSSNIARGSGFGVYATRSRDNPFADTPTIENVLVQSSYVLQSGMFQASTTQP